MALDIGAQSYGQWSGAHAVAWERYASDYGDVDGQHSAGYRHSYPFGLMAIVNKAGHLFMQAGRGRSFPAHGLSGRTSTVTPRRINRKSALALTPRGARVMCRALPRPMPNQTWVCRIPRN
jgi:hypothetical protein